MQKYSKLFGKTIKESKKYDSVNATFLVKAGFIDQVMAGGYTLLPLGLRTYRKIENIIRQEMDKVANEIKMTELHPRSNWERTDRIDSVDVLFKAVSANEISESKNSADYILGSTHEEIVTPLAQKFTSSYKDMPFSVYQIQTKFRNEARPKSGLLRAREFTMKDSYSFHINEQDLLEYYEVMKAVYTRIFERIGIGEKTVVALASGGDFTEEFSHEFQTICEAGEDTLFRDPTSGVVYNKEIAPSRASKWNNSSEPEKVREDVIGEGIIGVEELCKFLGIEIERTTKTMIFEADSGKRVIAAAVRGDYEVNELKLKKATGAKDLQLASREAVQRATGADIGYAGIIDLAPDVEVYLDDSLAGRKNFETGANKVNYHSINVNFGKDLPEPERFYDIKLAKSGDLSPESGEEYEVLTACEVGNIFPLNTKFSDAFDFNYTDADGKLQKPYMGCYGIGLQRTMGVVAEVMADDKGLVWPAQIAPYEIHLLTLGSEHDKEAEKLITELESNLAVEVLWDDRGTRPGEKFADSDLIGIPFRIVLSKRSLEAGGVELTIRSTGKAEIIPIDKITSHLKGIL